MINRHVSTCYLLIAVLLSGCNSVKEPQPGPQSEEIPQEVASNVYNLFSGATDLVARMFIRDKVWKVNFKQDNSQFVSVLDKTQHLAHAKLLDEQVPETLRRIADSQLIQGGTYTNFREDDSSPGYLSSFVQNTVGTIRTSPFVGSIQLMIGRALIRLFTCSRKRN